VTFETLALEPSIEAPSIARRELRSWLGRDHLGRIEDDVLLAASELVANAVVHARTTLELSYSSNDAAIEIAVRDGDQTTTRSVRGMHPSTSSSVRSGRGLWIVAGVADSWGVDELADGKRVWAKWHVGTAQ
jgi:anti-sigma regulatory factor (Ser/Thr protein kinase)